MYRERVKKEKIKMKKRKLEDQAEKHPDGVDKPKKKKFKVKFGKDGKIRGKSRIQRIKQFFGYILCDFLFYGPLCLKLNYLILSYNVKFESFYKQHI